MQGPHSAPDPKAKMHLQGQESDGVRGAVERQRNLKKKKDQVKKMNSKLKAMKKDPAKEEEATKVEHDIKELEGEISKLEVEVAQDAAAAAAQTTPPPSPATQSVVSGSVAPCSPPEPRSPEATAKTSALQTSALSKATPLTHPPSSPSQVSCTASAMSHQQSGSVYGANRKIHGVSEIFATAPSNSPSLKPATTGTTPPFHLNDVESVPPPLSLQSVMSYKNIHPAFAELAIHTHVMQLVGGNARTSALINALLQLVETTPLLNIGTLTGSEREQFRAQVEENVEFLNASRDLCAGMQYVYRRFLRCIYATNTSASPLATPTGGVNTSQRSGNGVDDFSKASFRSGVGRTTPRAAEIEQNGSPREFATSILRNIQDELAGSLNMLVEQRGPDFVRSGDVIMLFGRSSSVEFILRREAMNKRFAVIVMDSAPLFEGKGLAARLQQQGIEVTYALLTSACVLMDKCTKVLMGASAVLQSGDVMNRAGTAVVAAAAKRYQKPVICFVETYKLVNNVWIGSLTVNEDVQNAHLRRPDPEKTSSAVANCEGELPHLSENVASGGYLYDLTPSSFIDIVVTEMGPLHTSAIASALRDREEREV